MVSLTTQDIVQGLTDLTASEWFYVTRLETVLEEMKSSALFAIPNEKLTDEQRIEQLSQMQYAMTLRDNLADIRNLKQRVIEMLDLADAPPKVDWAKEGF